MRQSGNRYNQGKLRFDLITPEMEEGLAKVLTEGASKYNDNNWLKGLSWKSVEASLRRHLNAFAKGEDYDRESGFLHIEHILTNAGFLATYYKRRPEFDDRIIYRPRIALDIDGVICEFQQAYCERMGIERPNNHWHFTYQWKNDESIYEDKDFWMNLSPLVKGEELLFEPICYVTSRRIPIEWTKQWLEDNGFPCEPVYSNKESKVDTLRELYDDDLFDYFVDDAYKHFVELTNAGIPTYLLDRPYNRKYNVGHRRLYSLNDLTSF